jgi:outer membrane protein TolC
MFSHLELAQAQVKEARSALLESKEALGNKRADLVQIWSRAETIEEMIRILDQMLVPAFVEASSSLNHVHLPQRTSEDYSGRS